MPKTCADDQSEVWVFLSVDKALTAGTQLFRTSDNIVLTRELDGSVPPDLSSKPPNATQDLFSDQPKGSFVLWNWVHKRVNAITYAAWPHHPFHVHRTAIYTTSSPSPMSRRGGSCWCGQVSVGLGLLWCKHHSCLEASPIGRREGVGGPKLSPTGTRITITNIKKTKIGT